MLQSDVAKSPARFSPGALRRHTVCFEFRSLLRKVELHFLAQRPAPPPALQRLELHGWIDGVWGVTSNNRRARIYKITSAGRKQLAVETRKYAKLTLAIARVMGAE